MNVTHPGSDGTPGIWGDDARRGDAPAGDPGPGPAPDAPSIDPEVARELDRIANPHRSWTRNLGTLLLSVVLFYSLGLWDEPLPSVLVILGALLVHELGHLVAMKLLGYSNVQIFFIPFFGAAVSGQNVRAAGWKRALVTLAGPLTGLVAALGLFVLWFRVDSPHLPKAALVFAFLNVFNLLPLYPLDGGRFLQETLFSRNRYLEAFFRVLMGGLTILGGIVMETWFLALVGLFVVLRTGTSFKIGTVAAGLRGQPGFPEVVDPRVADARVIGQTQIALQARFPGVAPAAVEARRIWEVWEKVNARPPRFLAATGLLAVYVLAFVLVPVAPLAYMVLAAREGECVRTGPDGTPGRAWEIRLGRFLLHETEMSAEGSYHGTSRDYTFGSLVEVCAWRDGRPHGDWTRYDDAGKPRVVVVFDAGVFVVRKDYLPQGVKERTRSDLPAGYRALLDSAESRGPYSPKNRLNLPQLLHDLVWPEATTGGTPGAGTGG